MSKPKIILWDIETAHNITATFGMYNVNIPYQGILEEGYMICGAWKELGKSQVHAVSVMDDPKRFKKNPNDDYHVVKSLHKLLSGADAIIAHYGDNFDIKYLNTRIAYHGLTPLPDIVQIDTYKMCKAKFKFNCNRLDYVGHYLGVGRKIKTDINLWLDCREGKESAIKKMVKYNKQDVRLLEDVYLKLKPFLPAKVNMNLFGNTKDKCPGCGSYNLQRRGFRRTRKSIFQRYQCNDCGSWCSGKADKLLS